MNRISIQEFTEAETQNLLRFLSSLASDPTAGEYLAALNFTFDVGVVFSFHNLHYAVIARDEEGNIVALLWIPRISGKEVFCTVGFLEKPEYVHRNLCRGMMAVLKEVVQSYTSKRLMPILEVNVHTLPIYLQNASVLVLGKLGFSEMETGRGAYYFPLRFFGNEGAWDPNYDHGQREYGFFRVPLGRKPKVY